MTPSFVIAITISFELSPGAKVRLVVKGVKLPAAEGTPLDTATAATTVPAVPTVRTTKTVALPASSLTEYWALPKPSKPKVSSSWMASTALVRPRPPGRLTLVSANSTTMLVVTKNKLVLMTPKPLVSSTCPGKAATSLFWRMETVNCLMPDSPLFQERVPLVAMKSFAPAAFVTVTPNARAS